MTEAKPLTAEQRAHLGLTQKVSEKRIAEANEQLRQRLINLPGMPASWRKQFEEKKG